MRLYHFRKDIMPIFHQGKLAKTMFAISIDLDWAPDEVIRFTFELLAQYRIRVTVFCTHPVEVKHHEVALHPNFEREGTPEQHIRALQQSYPEAQGVRSHALHINSRLYQLYRQLGLVYSSSYYMFGQRVEPFRTVAGMIELPIFFEDDLYFLEHGNMDIRMQDLDLNGSHLKVFNFHPIHIFMNTSSTEHYHDWKTHYQDVTKLREWVGEKRGTRDFFLETLEYISTRGIETKTLGEIAEQVA